MNALIHITEREGQQAVDARELHTFLESKQRFNDWIRYRISQYGLMEGVDFIRTENSVRSLGRFTSKEYALTISCAKELAMVEGNKKGKQARLYFIECERRLKANDLQQRVTMLEAQVADLKRLMVTVPKRKAGRKPLLPAGKALGLIQKHFAVPTDETNRLFMSPDEIRAHVEKAEKVTLTYHDVAQSIRQITGLPKFQLRINGRRRRGYWVQPLTA